MIKNLVSICIPVFNGQRFLKYTLESLLMQDYNNFEIIILDNISTDNTKEIALFYANIDKRVRYICDDIQVGDPEGHCRVASFAKGEFFLIACDDDIYAPNYISTLLKALIDNPEIGMAYSADGRVDENNQKTIVNLKDKYFFKFNDKKIYNFCFYLLYRCPIPMQFGLMRTEFHLQALKYFYKVDHYYRDHDNLYMLRLLSLTKAIGIKEHLFFYRIKNRQIKGTKESKFFFKRHMGRIKHQILITKKINFIINESYFNKTEKTLLKIYNPLICLYYCVLKYPIDIMINTKSYVLKLLK